MKKDNLLYYKNKIKEKKKQIDILRQIIETISYNWNLDQILKLILEIVSDYTNSDSCFIYLLEKDYLILKASQIPHKKDLGRIKIKIGEGITGWVGKHKKKVVIEKEAYNDKRFKVLLPEDKYEAFLSVPIIFKDKVVGVINVQNMKKKKYYKDKVVFLEIIAKQVGGAIEISRLLSETNFLKEALETRKLIEKAKGILMMRNNLSENEAHKLIHKKSMDKRKTIKEISEAIIISEEISSLN